MMEMKCLKHTIILLDIESKLMKGIYLYIIKVTVMINLSDTILAQAKLEKSIKRMITISMQSL